MQHVVEAVVAARLLDGDEVVGLFDDADHGAVARGRRAEAAGVNVRQVVADRAGDDLALDLLHRRDEALHVRLRHPQDMEGEPLRRLVPDAGQALELVDQLGDRLGVLKHRNTEDRVKKKPCLPLSPQSSALSSFYMSPGGSMPPSLDFMASSILRPASLTAATMRSCSISTSPSLTASGSILMDSTSLVPRIWTVTTPPPAVASTTISSISFCIFSCICCACFIICCRFMPPGNFIALDLTRCGSEFVPASYPPPAANAKPTPAARPFTRRARACYKPVKHEALRHQAAG